MPDFRIEKNFIRKGFKAIAGVDEVGRGALFGPVVSAAVMLPCHLMRGKRRGWLCEIDDSKALPPAKRMSLAREILANAASVGVGISSNFEVDKNNIYWASLTAMKRAVASMPSAPDFLLVDGCRLNDVNYPQAVIPQGDRKSVSIAAASIVAKVVRDEMMILLDKVYEGYFLAKNKGYGTREHYQALREKGPTPLHRFTFNLGL